MGVLKITRSGLGALFAAAVVLALTPMAMGAIIESLYATDCYNYSGSYWVNPQNAEGNNLGTNSNYRSTEGRVLVAGDYDDWAPEGTVEITKVRVGFNGRTGAGTQQMKCYWYWDDGDGWTSTVRTFDSVQNWEYKDITGNDTWTVEKINSIYANIRPESPYDDRACRVFAFEIEVTYEEVAPEPATLGFFLLGVLPLLRRRR